MKGGYQILDLTGATAGSPVEVKGIYKAAAGNNGKSVMILTNDGQRVYAEIAEDDGDFITCYISAEGKTVNITIKSDDSVTTVISDPGASIIGLEQAVNELNDNKSAKSDITDLECTGTKNTTGNTIAAGRYFYLNGDLCQATADIANGATFTLNTNFAVVTIDEELSALNSNLGSPSSASAVSGSDAFAKIATLNTNLGTKLNGKRYIVDFSSTAPEHAYLTYAVLPWANSLSNDTPTMAMHRYSVNSSKFLAIASKANDYYVSGLFITPDYTFFFSKESVDTWSAKVIKN